MMIRMAVLSRSQSGQVDLDRIPSNPWTGPCGAIASVVVIIAGGRGKGRSTDVNKGRMLVGTGNWQLGRVRSSGPCERFMGEGGKTGC